MSSNRAIIGLTFLLIIGVLSLVYVAWIAPVLKVGVGHSAQVMCMQHFIAGRAQGFTYRRELSDWTNSPTEIIGNKVVATTPFIPLYRATSYFTPNIGCVLGKEIKAGRSYPPIAPKPLARAIKPTLQKIAERYVARKALYTRAFVVAKNGIIIAETYGDGTTKNTPHQGWSMTKSLTHALYGIAIKDRLMDVSQPPVATWRSMGDRRRSITFDDLFRMSSGLVFDETYFPPSDVTKMLFTKENSGKFAARKFMEMEDKKRWHYSSGTTAILSWIYKKTLEKKDRDPIAYMRNRLFQPLGMTSMIISPDFTGTPVGASFGFATAEDWLKLGQLYLQKGRWLGKTIVPSKWVAKAATPTKGSKGRYGYHWWINDPERKFVADYPDLPADSYWAGGFHGQAVVVIPSLNMVIARLGWTIGEKTDLNTVIAELIAAQKSR